MYSARNLKHIIHENKPEISKSLLYSWKKDPPFWMVADFESINTPVDGPQRKTMFVSKPIGVADNIVKNSILRKLRIGENMGLTKFCGKFIKSFVKQISEIETYMRLRFENVKEIIYVTISDCDYVKNGRWLCEKEFKNEQEETNPVFQDFCHLTGKCRELAQKMVT